jgi:hypothetical protein
MQDWKRRALALGKAVHAIGEDYYSFREVGARWENLPGKIYLSGAGALPAPKECRSIRVESSIGDIDLGDAREDGAPKRALEVAGIRWAGFRDLLLEASGKQWDAVGIASQGGWALIDYKTTSSIKKWAKTEAQLERDVQCNLYALDSCLALGLDSLPARWLYLETKERRRSHAVDVLGTRERATDIIGAAAEIAKHLDTIQSSAEAEPNLNACANYGGCQYHVSVGGPCRARRSFAAEVKALSKEQPNMPIASSLSSKFAVTRAALGEPEPGAKVATPDPKAETEVAEAQLAAEAAAAPEAKPEPARVAKPSRGLGKRKLAVTDSTPTAVSSLPATAAEVLPVTIAGEPVAVSEVVVPVSEVAPVALPQVDPHQPEITWADAKAQIGAPRLSDELADLVAKLALAERDLAAASAVVSGIRAAIRSLVA